MRLRTRLELWLRRWRRKRASRNRKAALREFVYLDEVSVYSLIASKLGPIAVQFSETEASSLQGETAGSFGLGLGNTKAGVDSRFVAGHTSTAQVLKKSIVQTTFRELYEYEVDSLAMRPIPDELSPPIVRSLEDLTVMAETLRSDGWIIDPEALRRGHLLETEVELEAEGIFNISAVVSALLEIVQEEDPTVFGLDSYAELLKMRSIDRIIGKLLTGLVPIRGRAVDYWIVDINGKDCIIHRRLTENLDQQDLHLVPLYIVGVTDQSLFWKDLRRLLFSHARFRILCRLSQDGLQTSWTPVKLAHVLEKAVPGIAQQINIGSGSLTAIAQASGQDYSLQRKRDLMYRALSVYAALLSMHYSISMSKEDASRADLICIQNSSLYDCVTSRRKAFDAVADFILNRWGIQREPLVMAEFRAAALKDAGLHISGEPLQPTASEVAVTRANSDERLLDTEFVAIYW